VFMPQKLSESPVPLAQGAQSQMAIFYRECDLFLSTASAGAPELPILEARASGTPVVAVDTSCFREVADYVVPPRGGIWTSETMRHELPDAAAMAEAIIAIKAAGAAVSDKPLPGWDVCAAGLDVLMRGAVPDLHCVQAF